MTRKPNRAVMAAQKKSSGFTLVEMLIAVSISAILLSLAIPSLTNMVNKSRVDTVTDELATALFYVRSEALKRRMDVVLCVSNTDGSDCEPEVAGKTYDYAKGWLIYMDCDNNGEYGGDGDAATAFTCDLDRNGTAETAELLRVHESLDTQLTVIGTGNYDAKIGYGMNGRINGIGGNLTIDLLAINNGGVSAKKVIVANTGRIRTDVVNH